MNDKEILENYEEQIDDFIGTVMTRTIDFWSHLTDVELQEAHSVMKYAVRRAFCEGYMCATGDMNNFDGGKQ